MFGVFVLAASPAFAAGTPSVATFTASTFQTLSIFASLIATFFLVKGGLSYISSTGKPDALEHAKQTIRNALIGLVLVLSAGVIASAMTHALTPVQSVNAGSHIQLQALEPVSPTNGLTQVLLDAVSGFLQTIVQSATKPFITGIIGFLTTTPSLVQNSVIFHFWLVIVGITDSLFTLAIALLGFHLMAAPSFGFDELELKHILPRIGLTFLLANTSLYLADWVIAMSNTLVSTLLATTGSLSNAWILNTIDPAKLATGESSLLTLLFMLLFVILTVVLLLFYIMRLITLALGAVLSPLVFLLWCLPKFSDIAEVSIKAYLVTIFTVFVHVVIIQLASAFLAIPGQSGTNSLISILVGIGLLFTLLKTPSLMLQMVFYNSGGGTIRKIGGQLMNVMISKQPDAAPVIPTRIIDTRRKALTP